MRSALPCLGRLGRSTGRRPAAWPAFALGLLACSQPSLEAAHIPDLAPPPMPDLAMADLAMAPPDLAMSSFPLPFFADSFDVAGDGTIAITGIVGAEFRVACLRPDGSEVGEGSAGAWDSSRLNMPASRVVRARDGRQTAVIWHWHSMDAASPDTNRVAFFDWNCKPLQAPMPLDSDTPAAAETVAEAAASDDGHFTFFYENTTLKNDHLLVFGPDGTRRAAVAIPVGPGACEQGGNGIALAVNGTSGDALLGCADRFGTRYYRRYTAAGKPIDTAFLPIARPEQPAVAAFQVGFNRAGQFVFLERSVLGHENASFFGSDGKLAGMAVAGTGAGTGERIVVTSGGDFVFDVMGSGFAHARYSAAGMLVLDSPGTGRIRLDGGDIVFRLNGASIDRNPFQL